MRATRPTIAATSTTTRLPPRPRRRVKVDGRFPSSPYCGKKCAMAIRIERGDYDPKNGRFRYFVCFKSDDVEDGDVHQRLPVEVALSVSENGELTDVTFQLPKTCRNDFALT